MAYTQLNPHFTPGARVEQISEDSSHYRLSIPSGKAEKYRLAQLDDYPQFPRWQFPHRVPLNLSLSARVSNDSIPGTWGFGLWNDPFGMSLGFGGKPFRVPALPNAVWFFGASEENYLSFKSHRAERSDESTSGSVDEAPLAKRASSKGFSTNAQPSAQRGAVNGFLGQSFRSPKFHPLLIPAALVLPFSRKVTRRLLGRVIEEDGIQLWNHGARSHSATSKLVESQGVDPTQWHRYSLQWSGKRVSFEVDDVLVLESAVSPNPPLGLVIWIDNQYAAFRPEGRIGFGLLENPEPAWLEVKDIDVKS